MMMRLYAVLVCLLAAVLVTPGVLFFMRTPDAVPAGRAASAGRVVVEGRVEAPAGRGGACAGWASSFEWAFGPHGHTVVQTDRCSASAWDGVSITDGTAKLALDPRLAEQAGHAMPSGPRPGATVEKGDCAAPPGWPQGQPPSTEYQPSVKAVCLPSGASVEIAGCREKDTLVPCDGSGAWLPGEGPRHLSAWPAGAMLAGVWMGVLVLMVVAFRTGAGPRNAT